MGQLEFQFTKDADQRAAALATILDYGIASGMVVLGTGIRFVIGAEWLEMTYISYFPAVVIAAVFLRKGATLLTLLLSVLTVHWFFVEPRHNLLDKHPADWLASGLFITAGLILLFFSERSKRALVRERQALRALEARTLELSASEEFNKRMLASLPDCVNMLSLDGFLLSINDAGKRLFEIDDSATWLRRNWVEIWPVENRGAVQDALARARTGHVVQFVANCPTSRGRMRWWDVVLSPVYDRMGMPDRLLAICRDATERQENEARRIESEERLRLALAAADDAIWDLDVGNDRFSVNESYEKNYGCPSDQHWRQWWMKRIHPTDQKRVDGAFLMALKGTARNWISEYRFLRTDGSWGHVLDRAYISRDPEGRPRRVVGAMMNLLPLRKAEYRAQLLAETSSLLLATESPQEVVNALCEKVLSFLNCDVFFNFLRDGTAGKLKLNAVGGTGLKDTSVGAVIEEGTICGCVANSGESVHLEHVQDMADARANMVRRLGVQAYACHPLIVRSRVVGTLSFGTRSRTSFDAEELSLMKAVADQVAIAMERQTTSNELRKINEELELRVAHRTESLAQTTEQLNSFCYSVAHDLRAPLRTQTGFARLLLDDYSQNMDETGRYYLKAIMQAAERQSNIIQDLMAHVNVSRADLVMEPVDLSTAVQQARSDLEVELQQKQATVDTSAVADVSVMANHSSIHLVLLNLISNACKFVAPGTQPYVRLRTEQQDGLVRLWVEDNGIGIDPEDHKRLFGMFQRLRKGDYPGTGMGLAIVKTAIEKMSGKVGLDSAVGKGSRFWIDLPKASVTASRNSTRPQGVQLIT